MTRADGKRQMSVMVNLMRWNKLDFSGKPQHHPIDDALAAFYRMVMRVLKRFVNGGRTQRRLLPRFSPSTVRSSRLPTIVCH